MDEIAVKGLHRVEVRKHTLSTAVHSS
jgi:hypothetical protein